VNVKAFGAGATLAVLAVLAALLTYGTTLAGSQAAARWTARVALPLFAAAFTGPAWNRLAPSGLARAVADREWPLSLSFVGAHLVHLVALTVFVVLSEGAPPVGRLAGGILAYALLLLVLVRPATRSWAFFYVWFAFFMTYLPRVQGALPGAGGDPWTFPVLLAFVVSILFVRVAALGRGALVLKEG
jgi:hypothetical protein